LITKHAGNLKQELKNYRIDGLFDEVIHIDKSENKADYIKDSCSIFIDDSFSERMNVTQQVGVATLDTSMIEMLLDIRK
jgi:hypothetical protein